MDDLEILARDQFLEWTVMRQQIMMSPDLTNDNGKEVDLPTHSTS